MRVSPACTLMAAVLLANPAFADEPAVVVRTAGRGDIETTSRQLVFAASRRVAVQLPAQVSAGDTLTLRYDVDGKAFREQFVVADIAIDGERCRLRVSKRSADDTPPRVTIRVESCGRVR